MEVIKTDDWGWAQALVSDEGYTLVSVVNEGGITYYYLQG